MPPQAITPTAMFAFIVIGPPNACSDSNAEAHPTSTTTPIASALDPHPTDTRRGSAGDTAQSIAGSVQARTRPGRRDGEPRAGPAVRE